MSSRSPRVTVVIPARYGSTRLPAKPLLPILGKPMIQWVVERAQAARGVDAVWVATDDERIAAVVRATGAQCQMTDPALNSGTDRVAAVADRLPGEPGDIFVNVQGDEPLMDPLAIEAAVDLIRSGRFEMASVMTELASRADLNDPSVVKVIVDDQGRAIYFSRHPIPYSRGEIPAEGSPFLCYRHVGLYAFTRAGLMKFRALPASRLERAEMLEQLRALQAGMAIGMGQVNFVSIGVDTADDLKKVEEYLSHGQAT